MPAISIDTQAYRNIIDHIVDTYPHDVEADPFNIATTLIMSPEICDNELTRTYGTNRYMNVSLYPLDVFAHTEQTMDRIEAHAEYHDRMTVSNWTDIVAHIAFELDLIDALEQKQLDSNNNQ